MTSDNSTSGTIKLLVAHPDLRAFQDLDGYYIEQGRIEIVGRAANSHEVLRKVLEQQPDLVLIDGDLSQLDAFHTAQQINLEDVHTGVIIISENKDPAALRRAIRAGVLEYLIKPVQVEAIAESIQDILRHRPGRKIGRAVTDSSPAKTSETVGLVSARSGVGKSTIAINVGVVLHQELGKRVAIVDFHFGAVALMLNLKPEQGIANLIPVIEEVDMELLREYATTHETGIDVYVGSPQPQFLQFPVFETHFMGRILAILKDNYDYVLADFPLMMGPPLNVLAEVDQVLVVTMAWDLVTLRETQALLRALANEVCGKEKLKLILNRSAAKGIITEEDVMRILDYPVWAYIPNDGKMVVQSVNMGAPIVLSQPNSPVAQSLRALARKIANVPEEEVQAPKKKFSLFGGAFH
jgi:pilus assembly protein CpaE